jgi:hypothetical protein
MAYRWVFDWMVGFVDALYIQLITTGNYTTITDLHTLQVSVTPTSVLSLH